MTIDVQAFDPQLSRLCVHTITTKPWDLPTAIQKYSDYRCIQGISIWEDAVKGHSWPEIRGDAL